MIYPRHPYWGVDWSNGFPIRRGGIRASWRATRESGSSRAARSRTAVLFVADGGRVGPCPFLGFFGYV